MIGIVGGLSPESTAYYYRKYIEISRKKYEKNVYPELLIYSLNFREFLDADWNGRKGVLLRALKTLESAGAKVIGIASNTPHFIFDELRESVNANLVSIVDAVVKEAGRGKFLLLGTKKTMESDFYPRAFKKVGGVVIVPEEVDEVHRIIMDELVFGITKSKTRLIEIVKKYEDEVDGVILGCTELPLAISQKDLNIRVLDSAELHVKLLIEEHDRFINKEKVQ